MLRSRSRQLTAGLAVGLALAGCAGQVDNQVVEDLRGEVTKLREAQQQLRADLDETRTCLLCTMSTALSPHRRARLQEEIERRTEDRVLEGVLGGFVDRELQRLGARAGREGR